MTKLKRKKNFYKRNKKLKTMRAKIKNKIK